MLMPKRRAPKGRVLKPRKAPKRRKSGTDSDDSSSGDDGVPRQARKRKAKQARELAHYTSAAWIEVRLSRPASSQVCHVLTRQGALFRTRTTRRATPSSLRRRQRWCVDVHLDLLPMRD